MWKNIEMRRPLKTGLGREGEEGSGGGTRVCIPVAESFWYLAKLIQFVKFKNKIKKKIKNWLKSNF